MDLMSIDSNELNLFSFKDYKIWKCRVVDVYDGDTCTIIFKYRDEIIKYKVRCYGYDSPEMKPKRDIENRDEIIERAKEARKYFSNLVNYESGLIWVHLHEFDKYGRLLGNFIKMKRVRSQLMI